MVQDAGWASYLSVRAAALRSCSDLPFAATSIGRAEVRLQAYLGMAPDEARLQARRCLLHTADAAFHDQLLASAPVDLLRRLVDGIEADEGPLGRHRRGGVVMVSLHYGSATAMLPLWLAMASQRGVIPAGVAIEHSRSNPSVTISTKRHAELRDGGFPLAGLDIAQLGELAALRRALAILRSGGIVLIFADGHLPQPGAKGTIGCRLGHGLLALARGPEWLARSAKVPLLPLLMRPKGDGAQLVSLAPEEPGQASRAIQALFDAAMAFDPAPWSRWCCGASHL